MPEFRTQRGYIAGGTAAPTNQTPWSYDTSSETAVTFSVVTGGMGKLYFVNSSTGEKFYVPYMYEAFGAGVSDLEANITSSTVSTPSGGDGPVCSTDWSDPSGFGHGAFPCLGYIALASAGAGAGGGVGVALFGVLPMYYVKFWCQIGTVAVPTAGVSVAVAHFSNPAS
jgi:hypothetical protein